MKISGYIKKIFKYKTFIMLSLSVLFILSGRSFVYSDTYPSFTLKKPTDQIIQNKPFTLQFILDTNTDAAGLNIKSFNLPLSEDIKVISSDTKNNIIVKNDGTVKSEFVFTYHLKATKDTANIPQSELILTDASEQDITLNTQEVYLSVKADKSIFKTIFNKIKSNKVILALIITVLIVVLILSLMIIEHKVKNK